MWPYNANYLECRSEMCCTRLAGNAGPKIRQKFAMGTIAQLCRAISSQLRHVSTYRQSEKNCPYDIVNFGLLPTEIVSLVWGTPANFNGFRVLAALLHGTPVVGVIQPLRG